MKYATYQSYSGQILIGEVTVKDINKTFYGIFRSVFSKKHGKRYDIIKRLGLFESDTEAQDTLDDEADTLSWRFVGYQQSSAIPLLLVTSSDTKDTRRMLVKGAWL